EPLFPSQRELLELRISLTCLGDRLRPPDARRWAATRERVATSGCPRAYTRLRPPVPASAVKGVSDEEENGVVPLGLRARHHRPRLHAGSSKAFPVLPPLWAGVLGRSTLLLGPAVRGILREPEPWQRSALQWRCDGERMLQL